MPLSGPFDFNGVSIPTAYVTFTNAVVSTPVDMKAQVSAWLWANSDQVVTGSPLALVSVGFDYVPTANIYEQAEDAALLLPAFSAMTKV